MSLPLKPFRKRIKAIRNSWQIFRTNENQLMTHLWLITDDAACMTHNSSISNCTDSVFIPISSKNKIFPLLIRMEVLKLPIRRLSTTLNVLKNDRRTWKPYYNNRFGWTRCKSPKNSAHWHFREFGIFQIILRFRWIGIFDKSVFSTLQNFRYFKIFDNSINRHFR